MRKLVALIFILANVYTKSVDVSAQMEPKSWETLTEETRQACQDIERLMRSYRSKKLKLSLRDGKFDFAYQLPDRLGCKLTLEGPISEEPAEMDEHFKLNEWEPIYTYMADGPCGGSLGYFKDSTFCLREHDTDCGGLAGPPPTRFSIAVTCIEGRKSFDEKTRHKVIE